MSDDGPADDRGDISGGPFVSGIRRSAMLEPSASILIAYRLTEADVRRCCSSGLAGRCWRSCRGRRLALGVMVALGGFLVGVCYGSHGARSAGIAVGVTIAVIAALAMAREARFERRVGRLARQMGLPRELRLHVSAGGIAEQSGPEVDDPPRTFTWPEVVQVSRVARLTVIRLRPARSVLIVPDSAFDGLETRFAFEESLRAWRASAR